MLWKVLGVLHFPIICLPLWHLRNVVRRVTQVRHVFSPKFSPVGTAGLLGVNELGSFFFVKIAHLDYEEKTFDPFSDTLFDEQSLTFSHFEKLRQECGFHNSDELDKLFTTNSISMLHMNIRSMINKFDELKSLLAQTEQMWDFIFISETWFTKEIEELFSIDHYQLFCDSRQSKSGGGSAIYALKNIQANETPIFQFSTAEAVFLQVKLSKHKSCLIVQLYRAPRNNAEFLVELEKCLIEISKLNILTYIVGDFNADLFTITDNSFNEAFFTMMCSYGFLPTISKATRVATGSVTLIDNIFCNDISVLQQSGVIRTDFSDHFSIFTISSTILEKKTYLKDVKTFFDYKHIDSLKQFLDNELETFRSETDPEDACNMIIDCYTKGINKFSKTRQISRKNYPIQPWVTNGLLNSINQRSILFHTKLKNPNPQNIAEYNAYRNCLNKALRNAKKNYYKQEFTKHHNDPKRTWETLNQLLQRKSSSNEVPDNFISDSGEEIQNDVSISNEFNKYFTEIGQKLKNKFTTNVTDPMSNREEFSGEKMVLPETNANEIEEIICGLNNVGAGIDNINAKLFKSTYKTILPHLVYFFNICLEKGVFPSKLKIAVIKPIFKAGNPRIFSNYRPISILPFLSKILEKLIHIRLLQHFIKNNLLSNQQFGFRKGYSTYMPMLLIQDMITKAFEEDEYVVGIFLDLRKAFDTVDHDILCKKLITYGVTGKSHCMIASYLSNRTQTVNIRGTHADFKSINIGVPQGSILGPLLFIIYINDLPDIDTSCNFFIYADDTAVFFKHHNPDALQKKINTIIPKLSRWLQSNYLTLNESKTMYQIYSKRKINSSINVKINDVFIERKNTVKYLGIYIDENMKFFSH